MGYFAPLFQKVFLKIGITKRKESHYNVTKTMKYAIDHFLKLLNSLICIYNDIFEMLLKIGVK